MTKILIKVKFINSNILLCYLISIVVLLFLFSNPTLMAHTFSENENALFLTMMNNIKAETHIVALNISNNTQQAQIHAKAAIGLLSQDDPVVNTTWTSEISELNPRVTADLLKSLNDLRKTVASPAPNSNPNSTQSKVSNIDNLLDEAIVVRVGKDLVNNPKTQALVLANLGNEIYNNYGKALGIPESTIASMGGMKTAGMSTITVAANSSGGGSGTSEMNMGSNKSSMNMSTGSNSGAMSGMNSVNGQASMNQNNPSIKNITAYEIAQSLASMAKQVFSKGLKPVAAANATNANVQIEKYIDQLKNSISDKAPFMNVMELVHVKLHPTLINTYKLAAG